MELRLTEEELAALFSVLLDMPLGSDDVSIQMNLQGSSVVVIENIPVQKMTKIANYSELSAIHTRQKLPDFEFPTRAPLAEDVQEAEDLDLLEMEKIYEKNAALAETDPMKRPLGPGETYDPPGEPTAEELAARKIRRR